MTKMNPKQCFGCIAKSVQFEKVRMFHEPCCPTQPCANSCRLCVSHAGAIVCNVTRSCKNMIVQIRRLVY